MLGRRNDVANDDVRVSMPLAQDSRGESLDENIRLATQVIEGARQRSSTLHRPEAMRWDKLCETVSMLQRVAEALCCIPRSCDGD